MTYSVEDMADRMAIHDMYSYYVHAIDADDYDDLDNVFLPDTMFDLSSAGAICGPWSEIKPFYKAKRPVYEHYFHMYGNILIRFDETRDTAWVKSKILNPIGIPGEEGKLHIFQVDGVYEDVAIRTPEGWRIKDRVWIHGQMLGDYPFDKPVGSADD